MKRCFAVLTAVLAGACAFAQSPAPTTPGPAAESTPSPVASPPPMPQPLAPREAADLLDEEEIAQLIDLLRHNYIQPEAISELSVARASAQGILERLSSGARVFSKVPHITETPAPLRSEMLDFSVGYLRLGALSELGALDAALDQFAVKPPEAMVLDLRATPHTTDFELAAEVCRRFTPKGRILFSIKRPKVNDEEILTSRDDPRWRGLLVVLVDSDTAGAAEVVAAVMRTHLRAYIVGQQTKGEAAQFEDLPLSKGKVLRVAIGEVSLPDNSPVFPGGLRPDLIVSVPQEKTNELLVAALAEGVAPLVLEKERPRMNEAALVAGTNPELDAAQERQKLREKGEPPKPPVRDEVLQRALDYITTVRVFEASRAKRR